MNSRSLAERMWGRTIELKKPIRIATIAYVVISIASLSFCQLGFWPIGTIDEKPVYLMLILAPLLMGSFLFGPLTGGLLGLFAGAVLYVHSIMLPLDFYEIYFMTPLNTFALLTGLGFVSGWLFSLVSEHVPPSGKHNALTFTVCIASSFVASGLMALNTVIVYGGIENFEDVYGFLLNSPLGMTVQALIDAALIVVLCWLTSAVFYTLKAPESEKSLLTLFGSWMALVSSLVFMTLSAIFFSVATVAAHDDTESTMMGEVEYLANLIEASEGEGFEVMLDGYETHIDGYVAIASYDGIVLASDDPESLPVGAPLIELIGYEDTVSSIEESHAFFDKIIEEGGTSLLQAHSDDGAQSMDAVFMSVKSFNDGHSVGYVIMIRTPNMIYQTRFDTMAATTLLALSLIVAIAVLATILLKRLIIRRIDETNDALRVITDGNLNKRVNIDDSREFVSLSKGINTTVSALRDTIEEVRQYNAQELEASKAIQESALPTEFPAFPAIDRFDIYASMKTAREVGGDFYDFFPIDEERIGFVVADVSGKGIPAALFMMAARTQFKGYLESGLPIGEAVTATNHQLSIGNDENMFVTMFACVLNFNTGELLYANAGHNPPLLKSGDTWEWLREKPGMPLGLFDGVSYEQRSRQLAKDDVIYLYTDGVTEAMDVNENQFGEDRLEDTLKTYEDMNTRSICVGVRRAITDFTLDCEQSDDITMLCLRYGVPPAKDATMILPAVDTQLIHVYNFIHEELRRRKAPKSVYNPLDIATEELFVNVCHYAYPDATPDDPGEVHIGFEYDNNPPMLTVRIEDQGIPYNPLAKPDAVTPDNIVDVPIGGLGILMAKRSVDEMSYERKGDSNVVTFKKGW